MSGGTPLRLGTRGSRLALIQAKRVADLLRAHGHEVEIRPITTTGDLRPPGMTADEGWFTQAIRQVLERGAIDLAVHSAKDLPIEMVPTSAFAFPERADPRDALLTRDRLPLSALAAGATVGTDSVRRGCFLLAQRPDLRIVPLHGNVPTRIEKLERGEADAIVLALAGLQRLGLEARVDQVLDPELLPPAPAQGALAVEVLRADSPTGLAVLALDDPRVRVAVTVERGLLAALGGGCRSPLGALAEIHDDGLSLLAGTPGRVFRRCAPLSDGDRLVLELTALLREEER